MGNPSLIATIGIDEADLKRGLLASEQSLEALNKEAKVTAAQIALLEREMAGGKTDEMVQRHTALQDTLRKTQAEAVATAKQLAALNAVKPAEIPGAGAPDESARYEAHWRKLEEQERSQSAHQAMTKAQAPAPAPAPPPNEPADAPLVYDDESYTRYKGRRSDSGESADGNNRMAGAEAGHSVRAIFGSLGAGQGLGQSLQTELPRLLQAAGVGIGAMVGVEAATGLVTAIGKGIEKARELKKAISDALGGNGGGFGGSSSSAIGKQMGDLAEQRDKLMGDESLLDKGGNFFKNVFRAAKAPPGDFHSVQSERDDNIDNLETRRIQLGKELADRKEKQVALDERAVAEGESAVAIDRERLNLAEKRRAINDDKNLDEQAKARMLDQLNRESAVREKLIRLSQQQKDVEDDAHHANAMDRRNGVDTEVTKAQHALDAAKGKRDLLPANSKEWIAAADDVGDKEGDLHRAQQEQAERAAQRQNAGSVAAMTGTDAAKQRRELELEKARLQGQIDPNKLDTFEWNDDKRDDIIKKQLPEVNSKLRAQDRSDKQREFQRRDEEISANTERGTAGQVQAIDARLGLNTDRQADNEAHEKSADVAAQLTAEAAELKRRKEEILFTEKESLQTLERQGEQLQHHGMELDANGKKQEIAGKYQPEIEKAEFDHDPAKAALLSKNQAAEQFDADVDEEMLSPQQKAERTRKNLARSQAAQRVETRQRRHGEIDAANHPRLPDRRLTVPNRINAVHAGAQNAGKGDKPLTDTNIVKGLDRVVKAVEKISTKNRK